MNSSNDFSLKLFICEGAIKKIFSPFFVWV